MQYFTITIFPINFKNHSRFYFLFISSFIFQTAFNYGAQFKGLMNGKVAAVFAFGASIGEMTIPLIIGLLFTTSLSFNALFPALFICGVLGLSCACLVVFAAQKLKNNDVDEIEDVDKEMLELDEL